MKAAVIEVIRIAAFNQTYDEIDDDSKRFEQQNTTTTLMMMLE
jgi:hypothetical protein